MDQVQVLIVEDEAIVSMDLRYKLENLGYCVTAEIGSGEEVVDAVSRMRPDLVLMDIRLSGAMDGIDAAAQIRDQMDVPVVYLTSNCSGDTLKRAEDTQPSGYLVKPFSDVDLRAVVEKAVQHHSRHRGTHALHNGCTGCHE